MNMHDSTILNLCKLYVWRTLSQRERTMLLMGAGQIPKDDTFNEKEYGDAVDKWFNTEILCYRND